MNESKFCAVLLTLCMFFAELCPAAGTSKLVSELEAGKSQIVVTYGTSLTHGGAWVQQLQAELESRYPGKAKVVNSGQSGMWSKWGVDNLEKRVIAKKPDTVLIEFAINDAYLPYKTSVAQARSNLENMIDRILKSNPNCEIVLMVMNPPIAVHLANRPNIKDYYQMYRDVAKARKLPLVDHYPNWERILNKDAALFKKYVPDGIHPGAEGCKVVITPEIIKSLGVNTEEKYESLFNGKDLSGWEAHGNGSGWKVTKDGVLRNDRASGNHNWLVYTNETFGDFVLKLDWRVAPQGNSGVFIRAKKGDAPWGSGSEVQITHARRDNLHCTGSIYGVAAVKQRPDESPEKWHSYEIRASGMRIQVLSDGKLVADADGATNKQLAKKPVSGFIGVQDAHAKAPSWIEYRNISIRKIKPVDIEHQK